VEIDIEIFIFQYMDALYDVYYVRGVV